MHIHIVVCCGVKRVLFTNKLSEYWCRIINRYIPVYKVSYIRAFWKESYTTCMFTLFFLLWCENGIVYQQAIRMLVSYH